MTVLLFAMTASLAQRCLSGPPPVRRPDSANLVNLREAGRALRQLSEGQGAR